MLREFLDGGPRSSRRSSAWEGISRQSRSNAGENTAFFDGLIDGLGGMRGAAAKTAESFSEGDADEPRAELCLTAKVG